MPQAAITDKLRAVLWQTAGHATRDRALKLQVLLARITTASNVDEDTACKAISLAHAVAGSTGVFGIRDAAIPAAKLEHTLRSWQAGGDSLDGVLGEIEVIVAAIDASLEASAP